MNLKHQPNPSLSNALSEVLGAGAAKAFESMILRGVMGYLRKRRKLYYQLLQIIIRFLRIMKNIRESISIKKLNSLRKLTHQRKLASTNRASKPIEKLHVRFRDATS